MSANQHPVRTLSLGAGVQSTTVLLMMIHGEIEKAEHAIFSDTGWEPQNVYQHLETLKPLMAKAGIQFHQVSKGNIRNDFLAGDRRWAAMPFHTVDNDGGKGMSRRQCTSEYKLGPLVKKQRELAGLQPRQRSKQHLLTTVIGISYDEVQRMKDAMFPWIRNEYPLVDLRMTRSDCIKWCEDNGYPKPPRSACIGCPFKNADEWRHLKTMPEAWDDAVDFDRQLRENPAVSVRFRGKAFLHSQRVPLSEADLRTDAEKGIWSLFDQECEGMCGL